MSRRQKIGIAGYACFAALFLALAIRAALDPAQSGTLNVIIFLLAFALFLGYIYLILRQRKKAVSPPIFIRPVYPTPYAKRISPTFWLSLVITGGVLGIVGLVLTTLAVGDLIFRRDDMETLAAVSIIGFAALVIGIVFVVIGLKRMK